MRLCSASGVGIQHYMSSVFEVDTGGSSFGCSKIVGLGLGIGE